MEAAGVLKDVPYKIEWKEFAAAAPLLEALSAGAIETGLVGDAPFTFAAAAKFRSRRLPRSARAATVSPCWCQASPGSRALRI
jgi:ABC-type nitrate/sulfonate/bicarbonate transport system substrate-binding protein